MDVVELQRQRIDQLEKRNSETLNKLITQIDINANLSHVLAYLTDQKFKHFASENNWNKVIVDYLESE